MATPTSKNAQKEPNIRKIYLPSDGEHEVLKHVYDRKRDMGDERQKFEPQWEKNMKQWEAHREPRSNNEWKSDIYVPMTTSIIEAQLAEIINQDMAPWVLARGAEDEPKAQVMNAILEYTWDVAKSNVALFQILKDALIHGTGIGMEFFWREPRTISLSDGKTKDILEYDDCYLQPIKLEDFYIDEKGQAFTGPKQAKDCIWRNIMDYDDFRTFFKGKVWDPMGQAALVKPGGDTNYYEFYAPPEKADHSRDVEVLWYWSKAEDKFVVVANDVVIRNEANPYKHKQLPFVRAIDVYRPYQFYAKGESEMLESLQEEQNTLRRMIIDRNHLDIDKPILTSDTMTIDDEDAMAAPHKVISVGDVSQVKFPEYGDIPASVFKSLEMLNSDKIRVTGMDESQQSVQTAGTATEAAILKEATLKRLNMKMWHIKNDTLVDVGRLRVANIMQFYSQPKLQEILGEKEVEDAKAKGRLVLSDGKAFKKSFRSVRLQDKKVEVNRVTGQPEVKTSKGYTFFEADPRFFMPAYGSYDIRYKSSSQIPISKPLEQQKADEMYDRLIKNPTVDQWKLAEMLLESREKIADDFKVQPEGQEEPEGPQVAQMVDLASVENEEMLNGNPINSTPYASVVHTQIHIDFINTDKFRQSVPVGQNEILQNFVNHITGEIAAQMARKGGAGMTGKTGGLNIPAGMPIPTGAGQGASLPSPEEPNMGAVVPDRIEGGGGPMGMQSGMEGSNAGVMVGRKV